MLATAGIVIGLTVGAGLPASADDAPEPTDGTAQTLDEPESLDASARVASSDAADPGTSSSVPDAETASEDGSSSPGTEADAGSVTVSGDPAAPAPEPASDEEKPAVGEEPDSEQAPPAPEESPAADPAPTGADLPAAEEAPTEQTSDADPASEQSAPASNPATTSTSTAAKKTTASGQEALVAALCSISGGFEIDGDYAPGGCNGADWTNVGYATTTNGGTYGANSKDDADPANWVSAGSTPDKTSFARTYSYANIAGGDYFVNVGWERIGTGGTGAYAIEITNAGVRSGSDGTPQPDRSQGGEVFFIEMDGNSPPVLADACVYSSQSDYDDDCATGGGFTAEVNDTALTNPHGESIPVSAFFEVGLNVTDLTGVAPGCPAADTATVYMRSITGNGPSGNLKGYVEPMTVTPPNTCGDTTLELTKVGDRTGTGTTAAAPVPGAVYGVFKSVSSTTGAGVDQFTGYTCTTAADGSCSITVPNDLAKTNDRYLWVAEISAPDGWSSPGALGIGDYTDAKSVTPYAFRVRLTQDSVNRTIDVIDDATRPDTELTGLWTNVRGNPGIMQQCGLDIGMVIDTSASISSSEMTSLKNAARTFVGDDGLGGTPSNVTMFRFDSTAQTMNSGDPFQLATASGRQDAIDAIDDLPSSGNSSGYTNWDGALQLVESTGTYDMVLFLTDGDPTAYGSGGSGTQNQTVGFLPVEQAIMSANTIKSHGTRIIGVGVGLSDGSDRNLQAISGPTNGEDYFLTGSFDLLEAQLQEIALESCGGTVTVVKTTQEIDGSVIDESASGWDFTAEGSTVRNQDGTAPANGTVTQTTDADGTNFRLAIPDLDGYTVHISEEQQADFELESVTCDGQSVPFDDDGFDVSVGINTAASCTVVNRKAKTFGGFTVTKVLDGTGADAAADASFTVNYSYPAGTGFQAGGGTVTVTLDEPGEVTGIPTGAVVTLAEGDLPDVDNVTWGTPAFEPATPITIVRDQSVAVTLTNPVTYDTGSFQVIKAISGSGAALIDEDTQFTIEYEWDADEDGRFGPGTGIEHVTAAGGAVTIGDVPIGAKLRFSERDPDEVTGTEWTGVTFSPETLTIDSATATAQVVMTNTYTRTTGQFSVAKQIVGDTGLVPADATFTVDYSWDAAAGIEAGAGQLTLPADGTAVTSADIPYGAVVHLSEQTPAAVPGGTWGTPSFSTDEVTIGDGTMVEVTLQNPIGHDVGGFTVTKQLAGDGAHALDDDAEFTVDYSWPAQNGKFGAGEGSITLTAGQTSGTISAPVGAVVTLTESEHATADGVRFAGASFTPQSPITITAASVDDPIDVTLTNTYEMVLGGFEITKAVTGSGAYLVDDGAVFTVIYQYTGGFAGTAGSGTLPLTDGETGTVTGLPEGAVVTFSEGLRAPVANATWGTPVFSPSTITIGAGDPVEVTLENPIAEVQPTLQLVKVVADDIVPASSWVLTATGVDDGAPVLDAPVVTNADGGATAVVSIPTGVDYALTEAPTTDFTRGDDFSASAWRCVDENDELVDVTQAGAGAAVLAGLAAGDDVVCTVTNTQKQRTVTVQKAWNDAIADDTAGFTVNGSAVGSDTAPDGDRAAQTVGTATIGVGDDVTVAETLGAANVGRYTSSLECTVADDTGSFTMPDSDVTCTFTNSNATRTVTLQKAWVNAQDGDSTLLQLQQVTPNPSTATATATAGGAAGTATMDVPVGAAVTAAEQLDADNLASYTSSLQCGSTPTDGAGFTVPAGTDPIACTITNTATTAEVTLHKSWFDAVAGDSAELSITGGTDAEDYTSVANGDARHDEAGTASATATTGSVVAFEETLTRTSAIGYASSLACTADEAPLALQDDSASVRVPAAAQRVDCVFTNAAQIATITLVKEVSNDHGGTETADQWTLTAANDEAGTDGFSTSGRTGETTVTQQVVPVGEFTLDEQGPAGYELDALVCTVNGDDVDSVDAENRTLQLSTGDDAVCTFTNADLPAQLLLTKDIDTEAAGGDAQPGDFTMTATPTPAVTGQDAVDFAGDATDSVEVFAGSYLLSEDGPAGFDAGVWDCSAGSVGDTVDGEATLTIANGQDAHCWITNTAIQPKLTLVKHLATPDGYVGISTLTDWTLRADEEVEPGADEGIIVTGLANQDSIVNQSVRVGSYMLREFDAGGRATEGYTLTDLVCADTATGDVIEQTSLSNPYVQLAEGDDVTCTFTNTPTPAAWTLKKTSSAGLSVMPGDVIEYQITVTHVAGTSWPGESFGTADEPEQIDDLSNLDAATYVPDSLVISDGGIGTLDPVDGGAGLLFRVAAVGAIGADDTITISYAYRVNDDAWGATLRNAVVRTTEFVCEEDCVTISDVPAMEIWKTSQVTAGEDPDTAGQVLPGGTVEYTLHAHNDSDADFAVGQSVVDDLTDVLEHAMLDELNDALSFDAETKQLVWTTPALASGEEAEITFSVTVHSDAAGVDLVNTLVPGGSATCSDDPERSCTTTDRVPLIDLGLVKATSATEPVGAGEGEASDFDYTLTVTNHGDGPVTGATVTDTLPAEVLLDTEKGDGGLELPDGWSAEVDGDTITVTTGALAVDAAQAITIHVTVRPVTGSAAEVPPGAEGPEPTAPADLITNSACVQAEHDADPSNDCSSVDVPHKAIDANVWVQCYGDVAYLHYDIRSTASIADLPVTMTWVPNETAEPAEVTRTLHNGDTGSIIWPAAAADENGYATAFPGWRPIVASDYDENGNLKFAAEDVFIGLVYDPEGVPSDGWRGESTVTFSANPTAVYTVSYPEATADCATDRPTEVGLEKTASVTSAAAGESFSYTLSTDLTGLGAASPVTLTDPIPAELRVDDIITDTEAFPRWEDCAVTGADADGYGGTLTCSLFGPLSPSAPTAPDIQLDVTVDELSTARSITNTAEVCFANMDEPETTECVSSSVTIASQPAPVTPEPPVAPQPPAPQPPAPRPALPATGAGDSGMLPLAALAMLLLGGFLARRRQRA